MRGTGEARERQPEAGSSPVLDVGGDIGALVVYLDEPPPGHELELCPAGLPWARFHTGVHHRLLAGHWVPVAVFPEVLGGVYDVLDADLHPLQSIEVAGGQVREVDLRLHGPV